LGYAVLHGPDLEPGEPAAERDSFGDVVLTGRLRQAIDRRNANIPREARDEALRKVLLPDSPLLVGNNRQFMPDEKGATMPALSDRRNIVVIADEAHRSQYDLIDGLARNMRDALPNASFIRFTGTPVEQNDANTRAVFGEYVSAYDIQQAVRDKATVPIYYESRIAKLGLDEKEDKTATHIGSYVGKCLVSRRFR